MNRKLNQPDLVIESKEITTTSSWASSPNMVEITLTADDLNSALIGLEFMNNHRVSEMLIEGISFETYAAADDDQFDATDNEGNRYVQCDAELIVGDCSMRIESSGHISAILYAKHQDGTIIVTLGMLTDLIDMHSKLQQPLAA